MNPILSWEWLLPEKKTSRSVRKSSLSDEKKQLYGKIVEALREYSEIQSQHPILNPNGGEIKDARLIFCKSKSWKNIFQQILRVKTLYLSPSAQANQSHPVTDWVSNWENFKEKQQQIRILHDFNTEQRLELKPLKDRSIVNLQLQQKQKSNSPTKNLKKLVDEGDKLAKDINDLESRIDVIERRILRFSQEITNYLNLTKVEDDIRQLGPRIENDCKKMLSDLKANWVCLSAFKDWPHLIDMDQEDTHVILEKVDTKFDPQLSKNLLSEAIPAIFIIQQTQHAKSVVEFDGEEPINLTYPKKIEIKGHHFFNHDDSPGGLDHDDIFGLNDRRFKNSFSRELKINDEALDINCLVDRAIKEVTLKLNEEEKL